MRDPSGPEACLHVATTRAARDRRIIGNRPAPPGYHTAVSDADPVIRPPAGPIRRFVESLWERSGAASPPPADPGQQVIWGLAQPILGMRTVLRDRRLLLQSLVPVAGMLLLAGLIAYAGSFGSVAEVPEGTTVTFDDGLGPAQELGDEEVSAALSGTWWGFIWRFWAAVALISPLPALFFAPFYARIAARGHECLGLGEVAPYRKNVWQALGESFRMAFVLAFSPLSIVPVAGALFTALWGVHWAVAEALDNARVLPVGVAEPDEIEIGKTWPNEPWFIQAFDWIDKPVDRHRVPMLFARLLGRLARLIAKIALFFARPWRPEVQIMELKPWTSVGFGIGVVVLLTIPGLNLLFRSACAVGGTNFRRQLVALTFVQQRWPIDNPGSSGVRTFEPPGQCWPVSHASSGSLPQLEAAPAAIPRGSG